MPRKFFRRWFPDPHKVANLRVLQWFGPLLNDPNLFHLNRHSVSLSFFIGLFCAYLPIPGQTIVAGLIALWWRTNLPIAVSLIWVSNPITIPPMFFLSYSIGMMLLGREAADFQIELSWDWAMAQGAAIWLPLVIGSLACGLVTGSVGYFGTKFLWKMKVLSNWEKRLQDRLAKKRTSAKEKKPPQINANSDRSEDA